MQAASVPLADKLSNSMAWLARACFFITIVLIPFRFRQLLLARPAPPVYKDFTDFNLFASDVSVLALLAFWGLSLLLNHRPIRLGPRFMWLPMAGLVITSFVTSWTGLDASLSLQHTLRLFILILFYFYVINEVRPNLVVAGIAVQVLLQSGIALMQFSLQTSIGWKVFGEHELNPAVNGVSIVSTGATRVLRAYGMTEHPNVLGGCLALGLLLFLAIYLHGKPVLRWMAAIVILIGLPALFVTFSRSAWLAFFIGAIVLVGVSLPGSSRMRWRSALWLLAAGVLVVTPLVWKYAGYAGARLNLGNSFAANPYEFRSVNERLALNEMGVRIFLDQPLRGIGLGASAQAMYVFFPEFKGSFVPPHFALLAAAMETGVVGLGFFLCLLALPWVVLTREKPGLRNQPTMLAVSVLMLAFIVIGFFDVYPWLLPPGRLWQWLIWGLWSAAYQDAGWNRATELPRG